MARARGAWRFGLAFSVFNFCSWFSASPLRSETILLPVHPCPNHTNFRVSRAYGYQCIHAPTIITLVFREHTVTSASMPNPRKRSRSKSIRSCRHASCIRNFVIKRIVLPNLKTPNLRLEKRADTSDPKNSKPQKMLEKIWAAKALGLSVCGLGCRGFSAENTRPT